MVDDISLTAYHIQLRKLAYKIGNSTTKVCPEWHAALKQLGMKERSMPRDVTVRWNSTYDMAEFAFTHKKAVNVIMANCDLGLQKFELTENEWEIVGQLAKVLKVSIATVIIPQTHDPDMFVLRFSKM